MSQIEMILPDGAKKTVAQGATFLDVAKSIGAGLAKAALAVEFDGQVVDLLRACDKSGKLAVITSKDPRGLEVIRHSTAHLLAMAVQKLWPGTQVTIGPVIEHGFFYDFAFPEGVKISDADFPKIEEAMQAIVKQDVPVSRQVFSRDEAVKTFKKLGEHYKVEIINDLPGSEEISVYKMGDWFDLCRGPHVPSSGKLGAFKLTKIAGAYWRGDEKNAMLTRIYGTAWADKKDLEAYLHRLEEAKKRDHRVLGKELDLFSFHVEAPANAFFHPRGAIVYNQLIGYMRQSNANFGFEEVNSPLIMNVKLWHQSGHYDNYRENMYFTKVDEDDAAVKPMNCPGHCLIYSNKHHSFRELPVKLSEFGRVHRHERSGVTHGLFRVRTFVQDDAHVFCAPEHLEDQIGMILKQIASTYHDMGFAKYRVELSTRPAKSIGSDEMWQKAETILESVLKKEGQEFKLNPGDGAFYGPKIDFHLIDSLERSWQCGTIQLDFSMPSRFNLEYIGTDDKAHTPVMIHRAVLGSLERFMGIFIEHYGGHFPLWACPTQARVINVAPDHEGFAKQVEERLKSAGFRVDGDFRNEKLGYKIRVAQLLKIPYMLVIGEREATSGQVSPRFWTGKQFDAMGVDSFVAQLQDECAYGKNIVH